MLLNTKNITNLNEGLPILRDDIICFIYVYATLA